MQIKEAVARMTSKGRPFTLTEVSELVQLPESLLRKELAARGVQLPPPGPAEIPWPRSDPSPTPVPDLQAEEEADGPPIDPVSIRPTP
jgi:hypothetical protein